MPPSSSTSPCLASILKEICASSANKSKITLPRSVETASNAILQKSSFAKNNTCIPARHTTDTIAIRFDHPLWMRGLECIPQNNRVTHGSSNSSRLLSPFLRSVSTGSCSTILTVQSNAREGLPGFSRGFQRPFVTVTKTSSSSKESSFLSDQDTSNSSSNSGGSSSSSSSSSNLVDDSGSKNNNFISTPLVDQDNHAITITPSAVRQIDYLAKRKNPSRPSDMFLRVYVDAGGCSGFQYKFEMDQDSQHDTDNHEDAAMMGIDPEDDVVIKCSTQSSSSNEEGNISVRVVIDRASLDLLQGCKVDFVTEMIRSSFAIVDNPQSESACGCGSSFAVKNFENNPALD